MDIKLADARVEKRVRAGRVFSSSCESGNREKKKRNAFTRSAYVSLVKILTVFCLR